MTGLKSESEKFAGAEQTYCIEAMMKGKRALQAGTSHNLGQNFARAFDVRFQNKNNVEELVYATSWGVSTRLIGAVIMAHGDDNGLRLPPKIAPYQVVFVPIARNEEETIQIKEYASPVLAELKNNEVRIFEDWSDNSPGFKFHEWEMKGAPIRLEIGPRDVKEEKAVLVRRDTNEKISMEKSQLVETIFTLLKEIQNNLFEQARTFRQENTHSVSTYDEFKDILKNKGGFLQCGWDGEKISEAKIKEDTKATIRCILTEEKAEGINCVYSGNPAKYIVIFAKAY